MRTLFTFALLSAIAFSGVAVGQEQASQVAEIAVEATETLEDAQASVVDLDEAAPSDAEIDTARREAQTTIPSATVTTAYNQFLDQGVSYPENIVIQDCGCQSGMIAPVVYQSPLIEGVVEGAGQTMLEGSVATEPIADATSVIDSPITDSAPIYADSGMITEGAPMVVQGAPMATGTPNCGCNGAAAPAMATEGLIYSSAAPAVSYQSAPVTYSSPAVSYQSAPATYSSPAPCCAPARRGFFRNLFGR